MNRQKTFSSFQIFLIAKCLSISSYQILLVAIAQSVYEKTGQALDLGYIGLWLFLPKFLFTLPAGEAADRFDRRNLLLLIFTFQSLVVLGILWSWNFSSITLLPFWGALFLLGISNAFEGPTHQALLSQIVPSDKLGKAISWYSTFFQLSLLLGPAIGGLLYAFLHNFPLVCLVVATMKGSAAFVISRISPPGRVAREPRRLLHNLFEGLDYVFNKKVLLGAISLDLFAVLFGGAVALLPIFANEILGVGAWGLGVLRMAPGVGAACMSLFLARQKEFQNTGKVLFLAVACFGLLTICFGLSKNFYLSLLILVFLGAADMVSVVIRGTLVQLLTPPEKRGRVSAVHLVFVGASNELGEFESGLTAHWFGTIRAVVLGGIATLSIVLIWAWKFPGLRKYGRLKEEIQK